VGNVFLLPTLLSQSQNQTWQVQKKTCQVKIKFGRCPLPARFCFNLAGLVLKSFKLFDARSLSDKYFYIQNQ